MSSSLQSLSSGAPLCAAVLLAGLLAACSTSPSQPQSLGAGVQSSQAERLSHDGHHGEAAQVLESLARRSTGEARDHYWLLAARERLRAGELQRAGDLLAQVSTSLPSRDFTMRAQIAAELALQARRPAEALAELGRIPLPLPRESADDILALRVRALFADNRPVAGVQAALERERGILSEAQVHANRRLIWQGLQQSAAGNADFTPPSGAGTLLAGWLELGHTALLAARNPFLAKERFIAWGKRYPAHPANEFVSAEVLPQFGIGLDYPASIALVLPLSGRQQAFGMAVRDGFLAAMLQQDTALRPKLNIYDTVQLGTLAAYRRAIVDGAQFIVGPLTKDEVMAVAVSGETSILTLALNQLSSPASAPPLLFQFSLDPEEEARQVAQRIIADGRSRGLALLPDNEWGRRVFNAFDAELRANGGAIAGLRFYDPSQRDFSQPVTQLLLVDESRTRAQALNAVLGTRLQFEPRRREDAQFVFVGAQPVQGRSLRPALRFHLAEDLPVYATSDIFEADVQANDDLEGVIFPDMPWIISPDTASTRLRDTLNRYWPMRARAHARLYAFGFDAYRLVPMLKAGKFGRIHAIPGMTGALSIDAAGRIHRELDWARVSGGHLVALGAERAVLYEDDAADRANPHTTAAGATLP